MYFLRILESRMIEYSGMDIEKSEGQNEKRLSLILFDMPKEAPTKPIETRKMILNIDYLTCQISQLLPL